MAAAFAEALACLEDRLLACASGRELVEYGFRRDVEIAAELDVSETVPVLVDEAFAESAR